MRVSSVLLWRLQPQLLGQAHDYQQLVLVDQARRLDLVHEVEQRVRGPSGVFLGRRTR